MNTDVSKVFAGYPEELRKALLKIRQLIYDTAAETPGVNQVVESLKWGQPSYATKTGTPIRLGLFEEDKAAIFFHCQTTLVGDFRTMFSDELTFSKNRAIVLDAKKELPVDALKNCLEMALTYHTK